jgi:hypothetical protein
MRGLGEPKPAVLYVWDPSGAQLELQQVGMMSGSDKHGLFLQEDPLLSVGKDLVANFVCLTVFIEAAYEARRDPRIPTSGAENRREPLFGFRPDRIRHIEDLLARSVVDVQHNGPSPRKDLLEVQYVAGL